MNHPEEPTQAPIQPDLIPSPPPEIDRHHLIYDRDKGFETRITLGREDQKLIGPRKRVRLKTHDVAEAAARRDIVFDTLRTLCIPVRDKRRRRPVKRNP